MITSFDVLAFFKAFAIFFFLSFFAFLIVFLFSSLSTSSNSRIGALLFLLRSDTSTTSLAGDISDLLGSSPKIGFCCDLFNTLSLLA